MASIVGEKPFLQLLLALVFHASTYGFSCHLATSNMNAKKEKEKKKPSKKTFEDQATFIKFIKCNKRL